VTTGGSLRLRPSRARVQVQNPLSPHIPPTASPAESTGRTIEEPSGHRVAGQSCLRPPDAHHAGRPRGYADSSGSFTLGSAISRPTVSHKSGSCARPRERICRATVSSGLQNWLTMWEMGRPVRLASSRSVSTSSRGSVIERRLTSNSRLATPVLRLDALRASGHMPNESTRRNRVGLCRSVAPLLGLVLRPLETSGIPEWQRECDARPISVLSVASYCLYIKVLLAMWVIPQSYARPMFLASGCSDGCSHLQLEGKVKSRESWHSSGDRGRGPGGLGAHHGRYRQMARHQEAVQGSPVPQGFSQERRVAQSTASPQHTLFGDRDVLGALSIPLNRRCSRRRG
jgi:hypothetical protein